MTPTDEPVEQAVLTAHLAFVEGLEDALGNGDSDDVQAATGAAMEETVRRVEANHAAGGQTVGTLTSSATEAQVAVDGDTATVTDCVRNDLSTVKLGTNTIVQAATGHRRPLTTTLERDAGGEWLVASFEDPGIHGPLPDVPVGLGEELPDPDAVCVPADVDTDEIIDAYLRYWDVLYEAGAPESGGPADPDHPALEDVAVDPQLTAWREFLGQLEEAGQLIDSRSERTPEVIALADNDRRAVVIDCAEVLSGGIRDASNRSVVDGDDIGDRTLWMVDLDTRSLKVRSGTVIEGEAQCGSAR